MFIGIVRRVLDLEIHPGIGVTFNKLAVLLGPGILALRKSPGLQHIAGRNIHNFGSIDLEQGCIAFYLVNHDSGIKLSDVQ